MDRTDLALCTILLGNSRTPYQDLADALGLSVNAVHKRIRALVEDGVIKTFTARVGLPDQRRRADRPRNSRRGGPRHAPRGGVAVPEVRRFLRGDPI